MSRPASKASHPPLHIEGYFVVGGMHQDEALGLRILDNFHLADQGPVCTQRGHLAEPTKTAEEVMTGYGPVENAPHAGVYGQGWRLLHAAAGGVYNRYVGSHGEGRRAFKRRLHISHRSCLDGHRSVIHKGCHYIAIILNVTSNTNEPLRIQHIS